MELKESKEDCVTCYRNKCSTSPDVRHCHCCNFIITDELRKQCKKSWKVIREIQAEKSTSKKDFEEKSIPIKEKVSTV